MTRTGQTIENPVTGERVTFHRTSRDTGGEYVPVEAPLDPGAVVAAAHVHPYQSEHFHVLAGRVGFEIGGKSFELGPGEVVAVPARTPHKLYNAGAGEARFLRKLTPALRLERHSVAA